MQSIILLQDAVVGYMLHSCQEKLCHIESQLQQNDQSDYLSYKIDYLITIANQASLVYEIPEIIISKLEDTHLAILELAAKNVHTEPSCETDYGSGQVGRPKLLIAKETLIFYVTNRFTVPEIANILHVSQSTVKRRMQQYGFSVGDTYSQLSATELDHLVCDVLA